jgi:hypothetical protein
MSDATPNEQRVTRAESDENDYLDAQHLRLCIHVPCCRFRPCAANSNVCKCGALEYEHRRQPPAPVDGERLAKMADVEARDAMEDAEGDEELASEFTAEATDWRTIARLLRGGNR